MKGCWWVVEECVEGDYIVYTNGHAYLDVRGPFDYSVAFLLCEAFNLGAERERAKRSECAS